jgi:hypothetical protein
MLTMRVPWAFQVCAATHADADADTDADGE